MYKIYANGELFCDSRDDRLAIINPVISLEVNTSGSFTFIIPPTHPLFDSITKRDVLIDVYRDTEEQPVFSGVCISTTDDFYKQRTVICEGALTFLNDTMQRPANIVNQTIRGLLELFIANHNASADLTKQFTVGMVTVTGDGTDISCIVNYENTLKCIYDNLVNPLGGYLRIRYDNGTRYIDYLANSINTNTQIIELGKNLIDFKSSLDSSEITTVLIPLGYTLDSSSVEGVNERLTIKSVNDGKDYLESLTAIATYGRVEKVVTWDDETSASSLKSKGQQYLQDEQFENMLIEARAIDLHLDNSSVESFKLLDKIKVISEPHGLNRYFVLSKMTINLNNPELDSITLGLKSALTISGITKSVNGDILKKIEEVDPSSILESARANASQMIQNAQNGFIHFVTDQNGKPTEMLIMDTNNIETATKVWRWNVNGLAYSDNGYEGPYDLAMTMDGAIVADMITTGTMRGDRIRGGELILGGSNNTNGVLKVYNATATKNVLTINNDGLTIVSEDYVDSLYPDSLDFYVTDYSRKDVSTNATYNARWGDVRINRSVVQIALPFVSVYLRNPEANVTATAKVKYIDPSIPDGIFSYTTSSNIVMIPGQFSVDAFLSEVSVDKGEIIKIVAGTQIISCFPSRFRVGNMLKLNEGKLSVQNIEISDYLYRNGIKKGEIVPLGNIELSGGTTKTLSISLDYAISDRYDSLLGVIHESYRSSGNYFYNTTNTFIFGIPIGLVRRTGLTNVYPYRYGGSDHVASISSITETSSSTNFTVGVAGSNLDDDTKYYHNVTVYGVC